MNVDKILEILNRADPYGIANIDPNEYLVEAEMIYFRVSEPEEHHKIAKIVKNVLTEQFAPLVISDRQMTAIAQEIEQLVGA